MDTTDDVMTIAQTYLQRVRRSGPENVMSLCPFHMKVDGSPEKHPSFAMSLTRGLFFCHSCGEKGNLRTFLKLIGLSRSEIELRYGLLIEAANKNLPPRPDPLHPQVVSTNPLPEALLGMFDYAPNVLLQAGYSIDTLRRFDVGFDAQHYRITYPIRDLKGQLVAISGRTVIDAWPRFKVYTKEYELWDLPARPEPDKRQLLYNSHATYPAVYFNTEGGDVVIVEGFKACMWLWQAGITSVVALLGTYLSWEQQWMVERMGGTVYLFLDNNDPGHIGCLKAGEKLAKSLRVRVMQYPERLVENEDAQPDNCTPEELHESKEHAPDYYQWLAA